MRLGHRRAALVEYDKLKALLRAELGVDPLAETEEAVRSLLAGKGVHGWPGGVPVSSPEPVAAQRVSRSSQAVLKSGSASSN